MNQNAFGVGEALVLVGGVPNVGHLDWIYGPRDSHVGASFCSNLALQSEGHPTGLAVLEPNKPVWPQVLIVCKFTHKDVKHSIQHFGPGQYAIALAVADAVEAGEIPKEHLQTHVGICSLFIGSDAGDDNEIFHNNYVATRHVIRRSLKDLALQESDQGPSVMTASRETASHLFYPREKHLDDITKARAAVPAI